MLKTELETDPEGMGYNLEDYAQIEQVINAKTRTQLVPTQVGKGDAINALGLDVGNALCDVIDNAAPFRHIRHLLTEGRLRLDLPLTQGALASLVGQQMGSETFSTGHVAVLNSLATKDCSRAQELGLPYVTDFDIREALA